MHWIPRYLLSFVVLLLILYTFASCTPEQVQSWTPIAVQVAITAGGCIVTYISVNRHRNRTRREAMSKFIHK